MVLNTNNSNISKAPAQGRYSTPYLISSSHQTCEVGFIYFIFILLYDLFIRFTGKHPENRLSEPQFLSENITSLWEGDYEA